MAAVTSTTVIDSSSFDVNKLTYDIFSILENKFLFGGFDNPKGFLPNAHHAQILNSANRFPNGKVRILSIDGGAATHGVLAANSLVHLESFLRRKSGNPNACISDFFDVVAGSGAGGVLAALLFTRGKDGRPIFTADEALGFFLRNRRRFYRSENVFRRVLWPSGKLEKLLRKTFGEYTLKDTIKAVLIPCYDLSTRAPFVFSRADAVEMDGYDFKMSDVCLATSSDPTAMSGPVEVTSVDGRTRIVAIDGAIAMNNPTAAAITHVLNNKQEFPLCNSVEDLLVVSLGNGESDFGAEKLKSSPARFVRIAGEGASDMVDQAVSMAFGQFRTSNYVRIQANGIMHKKHGAKEKPTKETHKYWKKDEKEVLLLLLSQTEKILSQKNVESILFQGKKIAEITNLEKLETFGGELIKEQERRKTSSVMHTVILKQTSSPSPRTSSATILSTSSSSS